MARRRGRSAASRSSEPNRKGPAGTCTIESASRSERTRARIGVTDFVASDGFRQAGPRNRAKSWRRSLARSQQEPRAVSDVELLAIVLDLQSITPAAALLDR